VLRKTRLRLGFFMQLSDAVTIFLEWLKQAVDYGFKMIANN
jgi:hypothetical protein